MKPESTTLTAKIVALVCELERRLVSWCCRGAVAGMLMPGTDAVARGRAATAGEAAMIPCGDIHHLRLTVTDVQRSREFYTGLLGFQVIVRHRRALVRGPGRHPARAHRPGARG